MWYRKYSLIFLLLRAVLLVGCGTTLSDLLSESMSENYMLAAYGTKASHPEINDGDLNTWGTTPTSKRDYTVIFPEEKKIDRIVIYSGNYYYSRVGSNQGNQPDSNPTEWLDLGTSANIWTDDTYYQMYIYSNLNGAATLTVDYLIQSDSTAGPTTP